MNIFKVIIIILFIAIIPIFCFAEEDYKVFVLKVDADTDPKIRDLFNENINKSLKARGVYGEGVSGESKYVIIGSVNKDGDNYIITLRLVSTETTQVLKSVTKTNVSEDDIGDGTDELVERIIKKEKTPKKDSDEKREPYKGPRLHFFGLLFLTDLYETGNFGVETRFGLESSYLFLPLEMRYVSDNFRIRTWPQFYFSPKSKSDDTTFYISPYTELNINKDDNDGSNTIVGLGFGYAGGPYNIGFWVNTAIYRGFPDVRDLLAFRIRGSYESRPYYFMLSLTMGTNRLRSSTTQQSSSSTSFEAEIDLGYTYYNWIFLIGMEGRSDNLGGLIDEQSKVDGIDTAFKTILKLGVIYKFH